VAPDREQTVAEWWGAVHSVSVYNFESKCKIRGVASGILSYSTLRVVKRDVRTV